MKNKNNLLIWLFAGIVLALIIAGTFFAGIAIGAKRDNPFFPFWERRYNFGDHVQDRFKEHGTVGVGAGNATFKFPNVLIAYKCS